MGWFGKRSETEQRKLNARLLFDFEVECRRQGWGADPALVYDEEHELFKWTDGRFAFSREHADWELLKKRRPRREPLAGRCARRPRRRALRARQGWLSE